jgi:hypothetical protein
MSVSYLIVSHDFRAYSKRRCEARLASDLGWHAEMMRNNQIGHLNLNPQGGANEVAKGIG